MGALLREMTRRADLCEKLDGNKTRCLACAHRCLIADRQAGICRVRFNSGGTLFVPTGYAAGLQADPIEKKPFYHALPGSVAFSFGMLGCDLRCAYCQNWITSQTLRDPAAGAGVSRVSAQQIVEAARRCGALSVSSTYNEPLITAEWAFEVFRHARQAGLATSFVSNGHATPEALDYLRPWLDFYKVDLKSLNPRNYRDLGGKLDAVLETIASLWERGLWVEIVTLVVTAFNDSEAELRDIARFIKSVSPDIPWHVTAFHADYRMADRDDTDTRQIIRSAEIGYEEGLRYVYAGNRPGSVGRYENTWCPHCGTLLVERAGFCILRNNIPHGVCPLCGVRIAGIWNMADVVAARQCQRREMTKPNIPAVVQSARERFGAVK